MRIVPTATMMSDVLPFSGLPDPQCGHVADSHLSVLTFYAESASEVLLAASDYLSQHHLDDYVASVDLKTVSDDLYPCLLTVLLEAER